MTLSELHKRNLNSMKESESALKSRLTKSEVQLSDLSSVRNDLKKLRSEFETLSKNHLRTTEDLNRFDHFGPQHEQSNWPSVTKTKSNN